MAGSKRSVPHLLVISSAKADEAVRRILRLKQFRTWTDSDGISLGLGIFGQYKSGTVTIELRSGKKRQTDIKKLSRGDQRWIRDELKRRNVKKRK